MVKVWQEEFQDGVNEYQAVKNQAGLKIAEIKSKQEGNLRTTVGN